MENYVSRDAVITLIEGKQKALCPAGRYGRRSVYGRDRDEYDAWQEVIDAIESLPVVGIEWPK